MQDSTMPSYDQVLYKIRKNISSAFECLPPFDDFGYSSFLESREMSKSIARFENAKEATAFMNPSAAPMSTLPDRAGKFDWMDIRLDALESRIRSVIYKEVNERMCKVDQNYYTLFDRVELNCGKISKIEEGLGSLKRHVFAQAKGLEALKSVAKGNTESIKKLLQQNNYEVKGLSQRLANIEECLETIENNGNILNIRQEIENVKGTLQKQADEIHRVLKSATDFAAIIEESDLDKKNTNNGDVSSSKLSKEISEEISLLSEECSLPHGSNGNLASLRNCITALEIQMKDVTTQLSKFQNFIESSNNQECATWHDDSQGFGSFENDPEFSWQMKENSNHQMNYFDNHAENSSNFSWNNNEISAENSSECSVEYLEIDELSLTELCYSPTVNHIEENPERAKVSMCRNENISASERAQQIEQILLSNLNLNFPTANSNHTLSDSECQRMFLCTNDTEYSGNDQNCDGSNLSDVYDADVQITDPNSSPSNLNFMLLESPKSKNYKENDKKMDQNIKNLEFNMHSHNISSVGFEPKDVQNKVASLNHYQDSMTKIHQNNSFDNKIPHEIENPTVKFQPEEFQNKLNQFVQGNSRDIYSRQTKWSQKDQFRSKKTFNIQSLDQLVDQYENSEQCRAKKKTDCTNFSENSTELCQSQNFTDALLSTGRQTNQSVKESYDIFSHDTNNKIRRSPRCTAQFDSLVPNDSVSIRGKLNINESSPVEKKDKNICINEKFTKRGRSPRCTAQFESD